MKIAIFANTPAQFHFWRNIYKQLQKRGHYIVLLVRNYGETLSLVKDLKFEYFLYSSSVFSTNSKIGKILSLPLDVINSYMFLRRNNPDIIAGMGVYDAFVSGLLNRPCIEFEDSEPIVNKFSYSVQFKFYMLFVDVIITPEAFRQDLGDKHLRIASYKELAYLHPNYYTPKEDIFDFLGISKGEDYVILRFNAFDAVHDAGIGGFSNEDKIRLVQELEKHAHVFISAEGKVPKKIEDRVLKIPKSRIHDVLYYAKLLVTDTQTMATEAALLGTPTIRSNKFVGPNDMGNFIELEKRFGLMFNFRNPKDAINKAIELVQIEGLKKEWQKKRKKLLREKIDITSFMVWFIENYPESLEEFKQNPEIQYRFR